MTDMEIHLKTFIPFYLGLFTLFHFIVQLIIVKRLDYFDVRKSIPLVLFFFSTIFKPKWKFRKYLYAVTIITLTSLFIVRDFWDWGGGWIAMRDLFGLAWRHWVFLEYGVFGMIYLELFSRKIDSELRALSYMVMLLPVVGLMYEFPTYHLYEEPEWFSIGCPFLIRSSVIGLVLLSWKIGWISWKQKPILILCILLSLFYIFHALNPFFAWDLGSGQPHLFGWIVRLPTLLFWVGILHFWKGEKHENLVN